jgi:hypothetical protein
MTKLTAVFRNFTDAPKNYLHTTAILSSYFLQNSRDEFPYLSEEVFIMLHLTNQY